LAAFALGLTVLISVPDRLNWTFRAYLIALALMIAFLVLVVAVDWPHLENRQRGVYVGLLLLIAYTGWRGWQAAVNLMHQSEGWLEAYVENVGFTLIALFDGFVIVAAIDAGAPVWLVLAFGALGIVAGRAGVIALKSRAERLPTSTAANRST
jgi:hypothetical protein